MLNWGDIEDDNNINNSINDNTNNNDNDNKYSQLNLGDNDNNDNNNNNSISKPIDKPIVKKIFPIKRMKIITKNIKLPFHLTFDENIHDDMNILKFDLIRNKKKIPQVFIKISYLGEIIILSYTVLFINILYENGKDLRFLYIDNKYIDKDSKFKFNFNNKKFLKYINNIIYKRNIPKEFNSICRTLLLLISNCDN